jgi:hypothetical protein
MSRSSWGSLALNYFRWLMAAVYRGPSVAFTSPVDYERSCHNLPLIATLKVSMLMVAANWSFLAPRVFCLVAQEIPGSSIQLVAARQISYIPYTSLSV